MGQRALTRRIRRAAARLWYERGSMEDTYGIVELEDLGLAHPDRVGYQASSWTILDRALAGTPDAQGGVFVDYGCGKGRVVYQAARRPFDRVIGIDIAEDLVTVARRNIEKKRGGLACRQVELRVQDALEFEPPDDMTVAYLYNPFVGDVFRHALDRMLASLERRPRRLTLIYAHPVMADEVARCGRFVLEDQFVKSGRGGGAAETVNVYVATATA